MSPPTVGVLALQGGVREHISALAQCGVSVISVKTPEQLESVQGLVFPGGESTTIIKLAALYELVGPMKEKVRAGLPIFGTCAGMILLADRIEDGASEQETVGGLDVVVQRNAFGRQAESFESPVDLEGANKPFPGVFIRAPQVVALGPNVRVISTISVGSSASRIVGVAQGNLMATAFHPELTPDLRLHQLFVGLVKSS